MILAKACPVVSNPRSKDRGYYARVLFFLSDNHIEYHSMGKLFVVLFLLGVIHGAATYAQFPFNTMDSLDINNVNARVLVHGDMWWNPATTAPTCFFPSGTKKHINNTSAIWMSGYDSTGLLHIAAQTYRQRGNDYWPGPLTGDTLSYATAYAWAKIWKVNLTDIIDFLAQPSHTTVNTPQSILTWPGKGNTYAQGNAGAPLTITDDMAPFIDLNGNGIYEPLLGDYPDIKGNQALWWVFSDNGPVHTETNGRPLGVEVHAMSYGYSRGTLIDDVVYYDYTIINKSANNYTDFRFSQWDNGTMGYPSAFSDYIGFDSTWRMGINYNAVNCDGCSNGSPTTLSYGINPPQNAITMIVLPGDAGSGYVPAGSFTYFNDDASIVGDPVIDTQYNNYMRSKLRNGQHFKNDYSGPGSLAVGYGSGPDCNYVFTGDPSDTDQWSQCKNFGTFFGDQRFVLSSNSFPLNAGSSAHILLALIVADSAGGCGFGSYDRIKIVADTAWAVYHRDETAGVPKISQQQYINIYPNPTHDKLIIECMVSGSIPTIQVFNTLGQVMNISISKNGNRYEADLSKLPNGLYDVLYRQDGVEQNSRFVKE